MVVDLGLLDQALQETRDGLDHRFLDEILDLGPATMENLSAWIWRKLEPKLPNLSRVTVKRDSDTGSCTFYGTEA
jgi:6-pyruvoyltetrahydropterin/6-carboxytetrahydropterin synthase